MILNYTTYTLLIFADIFLQCVISFFLSVMCNHLIVYCLHVYVSPCGCLCLAGVFEILT